jgi:hypothetical protein
MGVNFERGLMAKTNFTKVEEALANGLHHIKVEELLKLADLASDIGKKDLESAALFYGQFLSLIENDLKWMHKKESSVYKELKIKKSELKDLILKSREKPSTLSETEMERIKDLKVKVEKYKKEKFPSKPEDTLIELERKRHIYKRFNVNEKWLPLK